MSLKELVAVEDSYEQLCEAGIAFQRKTVESLLSFSVVVYTLQQKCKNENTDFNKLALDYWNLSSSGASQTAKVGEKADKFEKHANLLPASARTLYELATIPDKKFDELLDLGDVTPNLTVAEAKSLKASTKDKPTSEGLDDPFAPNNANPVVDNVANNPDSSPANDEPKPVTIDGEVVSDIDDAVIIEDKKAPKSMSVVDALSLLNIDVKAHYKAALESGLISQKDLTAAYNALTGK
jgi:hypothetical protein